MSAATTTIAKSADAVVDAVADAEARTTKSVDADPKVEAIAVTTTNAAGRKAGEDPTAVSEVAPKVTAEELAKSAKAVEDPKVEVVKTASVAKAVVARALIAKRS